MPLDPQMWPAEVRWLGEPTATYPSRASLLWFPVVMGVVLTFFGVAGLMMGFSAERMVRPGRPDAATIVLLFQTIGFANVITLPAAAFYFWRANRLRNTILLVFPDAVVHLRGQSAAVFRWEEIAEVRREAKIVDAKYGTSQYGLRLRRSDGRKLYFADSGWTWADACLPTSDFLVLRVAVERGVIHARLPRLLQALDEQKTIAFGKINVDRTGLTINGKATPWWMIHSIDGCLDPPLLFLTSTPYGSYRWLATTMSGEEFIFKMHEVPNVALLWFAIKSCVAGVEPGEELRTDTGSFRFVYSRSSQVEAPRSDKIRADEHRTTL
jgi:hypothetical protein